jgi:carbon monoxide dehydrogenase subunit G
MALQFENSFEVPLTPADAWPVLLDVPRIAKCLPGATLTDIVDAKTYKGNVTVKVGPVALTFAGTASFEEIDEANRMVRIKGSGAEGKGRGRAAAEFVIRLEAAGEAATRVVANSDVTLSGAVAQYGRGVGIMKAVADEIIARFAKNLEQEISTGSIEVSAAPSVSATSVLWGAGKRMFKKDEKPDSQ